MRFFYLSKNGHVDHAVTVTFYRAVKGEQMAYLLSISKTYKRHKQDHPDSALSERAIRLAIKGNELPVIRAGNRSLICDEVFELWLRGGLRNE